MDELQATCTPHGPTLLAAAVMTWTLARGLAASSLHRVGRVVSRPIGWMRRAAGSPHPAPPAAESVIVSGIRRLRAIDARLADGVAHALARHAGRGGKDGSGGAAAVRAAAEPMVDSDVRMAAELREAIEAGRLTVAYQPLFCLRTGRITGFEALARWPRADGPVSPETFIPLAEAWGLIAPLTDHVLATAARQLVLWRRADPARYGALNLHVNISAADVGSPSLLGRVRAALAGAGLPPVCLVAEITETALVGDKDATLRNLTALGALGVEVAVDDFGTGHSSLARLADLPVDCLKIDRHFVAALELREDPRDLAILQTIVDLGRRLGKQVIAEGVETAGQRERLGALGCTLGQGYHLSAPVLAAEVGALFARAQETARRALACAA